MVESNNAINNTVGASISGVTNTLTVTNPSDTASSAAREVITVGGATAGDPSINFNVSGTTDWELGIDNNDSDKFKLSLGTALGTADTIVAYTGGSVVRPLNTFFYAYPSATINNVTGDGTIYTVVFNTETYDIGGNFDTSTGLFTAPVDGVYSLSTNVVASGITSAMTEMNIDLLVDGVYYRVYNENGSSRDNFNRLGTGGNISIFMSAGDTAGVALTLSNGTKVADVYSDIAANPSFRFTWFSGYLLG